MSHRVLVLDANQRSALAVTRSLGGHGLEVLTADAVDQPLAGASRFSSRCLRYPDPATNPTAFLATVEKMVRDFKADMLVPTTDLTTMLLVEGARLGDTRLSCPSFTSYEALSDKGKLVELAQSLGVPVPATRLVRNAQEAAAVAGQLQLPLVVKPSRSRYLHAGCVYSTQVRVADSAEKLRDILTSATWLEHIPGLLQEFIPGHGAGAFALGDGQDIVAWFAHRRVREKPPSGGVSVLCESVPIDPALQAIATKLLSAVGWFGPAMIEFRVSADGTPYLMEVNGRFWGSLQLSIDSGIDFPWLLYRMMFEAPWRERHEYKTGVRLRWLLGDLDNLLIQTRTPATARGKAIGEFLRSFFDSAARQEVFRWSDPKPALREAGAWLKALA